MAAITTLSSRLQGHWVTGPQYCGSPSGSLTSIPTENAWENPLQLQAEKGGGAGQMHPQACTQGALGDRAQVPALGAPAPREAETEALPRAAGPRLPHPPHLQGQSAAVHPTTVLPTWLPGKSHRTWQRPESQFGKRAAESVVQGCWTGRLGTSKNYD